MPETNSDDEKWTKALEEYYKVMDDPKTSLEGSRKAWLKLYKDWDKINKTKTEHDIFLKEIYAGNLKAVQKQIRGGADVNALDTRKQSYVHIASGFGFHEIVQALIDAGANVNTVCEAGTTPLLSAIHENHTKVVFVLINAGVDVNIEAKLHNITPLHCAVLNNNFRVVKALLNAGANKHKKTDFGETALSLAKKRGFKQIVNLLKNHRNKKAGKDDWINEVIENENEETRPVDYLMACIFDNDLEAVKECLENEVDLNKPIVQGDIIGLSVLIFALTLSARFDNTEIIKALIEKGANVNYREPKVGLSPIFVAVVNGDVENTKILLDAGANPNVRNCTFWSPLDVAKDKNNQELVETLLKAGAF